MIKMQNHPKKDLPVTTLFVDVGGALLTNGWGRQSRKLAADTSGLNLAELEERHHLTFDTYEVGKMTMNTSIGWFFTGGRAYY